MPVTDDGQAYDVLFNSTLATYGAGGSYGCWYEHHHACSELLTPRNFAWNGTDYTITYLYLDMMYDT